MKTILVPVDFSKVTPTVVRAAAKFAGQTGGQLVFLHVVQPPVVVDVYGLGQEVLADALTASEQITTRKLRLLCRQAARSGIKARAVQQTGSGVREILETARRLKAASIVIGSHGHGAAYDLIIGSTTTGVLRKARCPVLVVPTGARVR